MTRYPNTLRTLGTLAGSVLYVGSILWWSAWCAGFGLPLPVAVAVGAAPFIALCIGVSIWADLTGRR